MIQCSKCGRTLTLTESATDDGGHCSQCAIEARALRDEEKRPAAPYIGLNRKENEKGKDPLAGLRPARTRGSVLLEAHKIINGQRQDQYGNPEDCFKSIAQLWQAYLDNLADHQDDGDLLPFIAPRIDAFDVAMMMALMKVGRMQHGAGSVDSATDCAGYIALAEDIRSASVNHKGGMA